MGSYSRRRHRKGKPIKRKTATRKTAKRHMRGGKWGGNGVPARVGCSWNGGNLNRWPGVAGVSGQTNYLELSKNGVAVGGSQLPVSTSKMMGGRHCSKKHRATTGKRRRRSRRGGCGCASAMTGGSGLTRGRLFPEQLVNAYRSVIHAPSKFINEWGGFNQPANLTAAPTYQPALDDQKMPRMAVGSRISGQAMSTATGTVAM